MESYLHLLTWSHILGAAMVYLSSLVIWRLFFHPLARFPGPKLAAITIWYEGYYDLYLKGQYTFKIAQLHKKYGPIIRISPHEIHVDDPAFFNTLYRRDGVWHKYDWAVDGFATKGATIWTADHHVHKSRRQSLAPYFSKSRVAKQEQMIQHHLHKLCHRLRDFAASKKVVDLGAAMTAYIRDVTNEFLIGKSYNDLEKDDFNNRMVIAAKAGGSLWRTTKFIRWFGPFMKSIPPQWVIATADPVTKTYFRYLLGAMQDTKDLMNAATSYTHDQVESNNNLVDEIMRSKLSAKEKSFHRVFEELSTTCGAGFETTAGVLRLIIFHVFSNHAILQKLRTELSRLEELNLKSLEQLPYLTATIMEGMRLSPAIATRAARISPGLDIVYSNWTIPAGTPIGMTPLYLHRNHSHYPRPNDFLPERWMDPDPWKIGDKLFEPFSKGTRICLGMHFAWAEMYLLLSILIQDFDFDFQGAAAADFECVSDEFAIGTNGDGVLKALVHQRL